MNNPAVLLDLNKDIFLETTPMEHLHLLLTFMSGPESVANMISQVEEDPTLSTPNDPAPGSFVPYGGGFSELQRKRSSSAANKQILSSMLPLEAESHLNEPSSKFDLLNPKLFRGGQYNFGGSSDDFLPSNLDRGIHELVKNEVEVKDESFGSTIFQNQNNVGSTRFFYSMTNDETMKAESSFFKTYSGSFGHKRKPVTIGKSTPNALQTTVKGLLTTKPRESSRVCKKDGLSSLDFIQRVCRTKIDLASKLYTCKTCMRNFKQKCHLYRHQRQHSGVKRFFCIQCNRGFYQRSNLSAHSRTHSNDSSISHRYACTFCTKRFTRNSSLMKHLARHSKGLIKMK